MKQNQAQFQNKIKISPNQGQGHDLPLVSKPFLSARTPVRE